MKLVKRSWKYKLDEPFSIYNKTFIKSKGKKFRSKKGVILCSIDVDGEMTIFPGYAWDGCTPNFSILGLFFIGTPDGHTYYATGKPITYYASLVHDALYQFRPVGTTRKDADDLFYEILKKSQFQLAYVYYKAVRIFGRFFWKD